MSQTLRYDIKAICVLCGPRSSLLRSRCRRYNVGLSRDFRSWHTPANHTTCSAIRSSYSKSNIPHIRPQHNAAAVANNPPSNKTDNAVEDVEPPQPPLAIVFTDIVKSTAIWEKNFEAMGEAMAIHDDLIRRLTKAYGGYEVKQNGDGFMIAFQDAIPALKFCLSVQLQLQDQKWPEELLKLGPASPVVQTGGDQVGDEPEEVVLWKGLRLRVSAHFGEPLSNWNEVINRMDYLGPAVNRAARYVSVCEGGQIVVSQEFLEELHISEKDSIGGEGPLFDDTQTQEPSFQEIDLSELSPDQTTEGISDTKFEVLKLGERHFKGVSDQQKLFVIMPKSLHGRLNYFPRQIFVQPSKGNLIDSG